MSDTTEYLDISRYQLIKSVDDLPTRKYYAYPLHVRTYWRYDNDFFVEKTTRNFHVKQQIHESPEEQFGLTQKEVFNTLLELFGGEHGFYVADLKNRQYFYSKNYDDLEPILIKLGARVVS